MRTILFLTLLAALLGGCGGSAASSSETASSDETSGGTESSSTFAMISVADVAAHLGPDQFVYDANSRETFDQHHVPGATWVHYDTITAETLPADPAAALVFYCANEHCSASHNAAERAIELGHTNVSVMGAGIAGWIDAGQPVEGSEATN